MSSPRSLIWELLASLHSLLLEIWEREDLGAECNEWMTEARALSYDMEDDIDDLMLGFEHSDDVGHGGLNRLFQNLKMRVEAVSRQCHEEWKQQLKKAVSRQCHEAVSRQCRLATTAEEGPRKTTREW
jgi:hypothetical protein